MRSRQKGLTLVELMVALVLGLLVMTGVIQLFIGNKKTYRAQDGLARLQETGRFAVFIMNKDFRGAGNMGCTRTDFMDYGVTAVGTPTEVNLHSGGFQTITGYNDVTAAMTLPSGTNITPVSGSDVLNVRGISPITGIRQLSGVMTSNTSAMPITTPAEGLSGSHYLGIAEGDLLFISDCEAGDIFKASNTPSDSLEHELTGSGEDPATHNYRTNLKKPYGEDAVITKVRSNTYYVAREARTYDGQTVSSLHRVDMNGTDTELVEGIEDMQVVYGIDADANRIVDRYVTANNVTDWGQVLNVKVNLLINSVARATDAAAPYKYSPKGAGDITPASDDRRLRREFSFVTTVRNHTL